MKKVLYSLFLLAAMFVAALSVSAEKLEDLVEEPHLVIYQKVTGADAPLLETFDYSIRGTGDALGQVLNGTYALTEANKPDDNGVITAEIKIPLTGIELPGAGNFTFEISNEYGEKREFYILVRNEVDDTGKPILNEDDTNKHYAIIVSQSIVDQDSTEKQNIVFEYQPKTHITLSKEVKGD